jgi:hypothetical protein
MAIYHSEKYRIAAFPVGQICAIPIGGQAKPVLEAAGFCPPPPVSLTTGPGRGIKG